MIQELIINEYPGLSAYADNDVVLNEIFVETLSQFVQRFSCMNIALYIILGIITGCASGFLGIGGGFILVPLFIAFFGMSQHMAQGTTLAMMVPPITFLAALRYYQNGNVDLKIAGIVGIGFVIGSLLGAEYAQQISTEWLGKIFGFIMIIFGIKMLFL